MSNDVNKAKFICADEDNNIGYGETENEAYDDYLDNANGGVLDLYWYSVKPIQVSVKIKMKTVTETEITRK